MVLLSRMQSQRHPALTCICLAIVFLLSPTSVRADEPWPEIRLDPVFARLLKTPDALLVKYLHDHSCKPLLENLGIETDANGLAVSRFPRKKLAFHSRYKAADGASRFVLLYDPVFHSWPGTQPETIVITDTGYRLLAWREVGGSPMFETAELEYDATENPVLVLTCSHRHSFTNPRNGKYRFLLAGDQIRAVPEVEWIYANQDERNRYEKTRRAIEARER